MTKDTKPQIERENKNKTQNYSPQDKLNVDKSNLSPRFKVTPGDIFSKLIEEKEKEIKQLENRREPIGTGDDMYRYNNLNREIDLLTQLSKKITKEGDKLFYYEDYANQKISCEEFNYASKKWDKFKTQLSELNLEDKQ